MRIGSSSTRQAPAGEDQPPLEAAAGVVGLVKTALALSRRRIPPSINFHRPNPRIDFDGLGLRVQTEASRWPGQENLIAGVSSFGIPSSICWQAVCSSERAERTGARSSAARWRWT